MHRISISKYCFWFQPHEKQESNKEVQQCHYPTPASHNGRTTPNQNNTAHERINASYKPHVAYEKSTPYRHNAPAAAETLPHNKYRSPVELEPDRPHYDMPPKVNPYLQTILPYDKSNSCGFVNVNSHIRRPKVSTFTLFVDLVDM